MDDPNEPVWSRAMTHLQRNAKVEGGKWVPAPEKFNMKPAPQMVPNLEDRLLEDDRKKKREAQAGINMDRSQKRADETAYGVAK